MQLLFAPGAFDTGIAPIDWLHRSGWLFVDMFFVLSGYIFAHVYVGRDLLKDGRSLADFGVARIARLYPLHLAMLLVTALLFWSKPENTALNFTLNLTMLQVFATPLAHNFDGPSWSLSVEMVCYALFAVGAAAGQRGLRLAIAVAIALSFVSLLSHAAPDGPYGRDNFPRGLLGFFLGQALWQLRGALARVPGWVFAALIVAGAMIPPEAIGVILPLALVSFPAALLLGLRLPVLESRLLVWLGDRSYAIYLIHMPLLDLFLQWHAPVGGSSLQIIAASAGFVGLTLLLSELAFHWVEAPARRAIRAAWVQRSAKLATA